MIECIAIPKDKILDAIKSIEYRISELIVYTIKAHHLTKKDKSIIRQLSDDVFEEIDKSLKILL